MPPTKPANRAGFCISGDTEIEFHDGIAARTIYGEARGEVTEGKLAVAHVIRNRLKSLRWGHTIASVCLWPAQFSCWLTSDPNRRKMLELGDVELTTCAEAWFKSAGTVDLTSGAMFYQVIGTDARWSLGHVPCVTIGHHQFFNDVK